MAINKVVVAAGGTGGHVFPALALYRRLRQDGVQVILATDERGLAYTDGFDDADIVVLPAGGIVSGSIPKRVSGLFKLGHGFVKSIGLLRREKPDAVIGMGGYPSVGPLLSAQVLRIPNVLHEQNSVMGAANKVIARGANKVALSFPETEGAVGNTQLTGNMLRSSVIEVGESSYPTPTPGRPLKIVVMGGSQGAHSISEAVPAALAQIDEDLRKRIHVVHQGRPEDVAAVTEAYGAAGVTSEVVTFVDVPTELVDTHLVISRSGASTVGDVAVARRPAIYLPLLTNPDLQQVKNANSVASVGGAVVHREDEGDATDLAALISSLLSDPQRLTQMADAARAWSRPHAVDDVVAIVETINSKK